MPKATARHILVSSESECEELKQQIENGTDFAEVAANHSQCPSGQKGGDLGEFSPGQMVQEFDTVVFSHEIGKVHGPVQTQFGYHLIEITSRTYYSDRYRCLILNVHIAKTPSNVNINILEMLLSVRFVNHCKSCLIRYCLMAPNSMVT